MPDSEELEEEEGVGEEGWLAVAARVGVRTWALGDKEGRGQGGRGDVHGHVAVEGFDVLVAESVHDMDAELRSE